MYQDFLARGEAQRKEHIRKCQQLENMRKSECGKKDTNGAKDKAFPQLDNAFLPHLTSNSKKMINSDLSEG